MREDDPFQAGVGGGLPDDSVPDTAQPVQMDVGPILSRCVELMKAQPGLVIGAGVLSVVPGLIISGIDTALNLYVTMNEVSDEVTLVAAFTRVALTLTSMLLGVFLQLGVVRIYLNLARGGSAELGMLVAQGGHFLPAIAGAILFGMAYLLGLLLFIIPGIIALTGLQFFLYAMIDKDLGPIEALSESWRLTDGYKLTIFLINLVVGFVAMMFCCATFGIGYFIAVPLMSLASAVMYHALTHLQRPSSFGG